MSLRRRINRFLIGLYTVALVLATTLLLGWVGPSIDYTPLTAQEQATLDCRSTYGEAVAEMRPDGSHRCLDKYGRKLTPR